MTVGIEIPEFDNPYPHDVDIFLIRFKFRSEIVIEAQSTSPFTSLMMFPMLPVESIHRAMSTAYVKLFKMATSPCMALS